MITIAYIAGCERSGTTLLARLLGELPGFTSVGEAGRHFLGPGNLGGMAIPCGCGAAMPECPFWSRVTFDPRWRTLARPFMRARYIHRALWWRPEKHDDLRRFLDAASEFYHGLATLTGAQVLVDSSKSPVFAALLSQAPAIRVHMIHMIRDLRGVVGSWQRPKAYVSAMPYERSILQWYRANIGSEVLKSRAAGFSRLRYEDCIAHPRSALEDLASGITGSPVRCNFLREGHAHLQAQHLAGGNPDKFQCGEIPLQEHKPSISPVLRGFVSVAGAPLLLRYGYFSKNGHRAGMRSGQLASSLESSQNS